MRDYVDDIMLREVSHDIPTLIHKVPAGLQFAKQLIRHAGLKDNEAKEHIFIPNKKVSDALKLAYPDMADKVVNVAKDFFGGGLPEAVQSRQPGHRPAHTR